MLFGPTSIQNLLLKREGRMGKGENWDKVREREEMTESIGGLVVEL